VSPLIRTIAEAVASIPKGAVVGIAGAGGARRPLALVRELARQGRTDVRLVGWADGPEASLIGCEPLTVVPPQAFQAAALGVDFLPQLSTGTGTTSVVSPVSGQVYDAIASVRPDVVLVHADAADEEGNVLLSADPATWRNDSDLVAAGVTVIASVEQLVSTLAIAESPRDLVAAPPASPRLPGPLHRRPGCSNTRRPGRPLGLP
jgi:glutaconate CoA-transferase subunit A